MSEQLTGFAKIKWDIAQIQFQLLGMNAEKTMIEANPATHRIAEYIEANYLPKTPSLNAGSLEVGPYTLLNDRGLISGHDEKYVHAHMDDIIEVMKEFASLSKGGESIVDKLYKVKEIIQKIRDKDETNAFNRDIHSQHAGNIHNAIETINSYWHSVYVIDNPSPRPSLDIDKVVEELRRLCLYRKDARQEAYTVWNECCNKLKELLNQKEGK